MIAIGIAMFFFGLIFMNLFGTHSKWSHNFADWTGGLSLLAGIILFISGMVSAAWKYLP